MMGSTLAFVAFILIFSSIPIQPVAAQQQPLFSMTLLAPTSNPVRRQWAAIITNSFQSVGIDAKLVYVSFGALISRVWPDKCPCGQLFDQGGYDAVFIGWGGGTVLPDFGTSNVVNYRYESASDVPNVGNNYAFFKNDTLNSLMDAYATEFNATKRVELAHKMIEIVAQERPYLIILYPASTVALANYVFPWGTQTAWTDATTGVDIQHYKLTQGDTLNIAMTGDVNSVNQLPNSQSNSLYDRYLYGLVSAGLEELDTRTLTYYKALATSITSSPDHLTWTVKFRPHTFHDGVQVTADDYVFTYMSLLRSDAGFVGLGTMQGLLGLNSTFTFLNGTTRYISNGTYYMTAPPSGFKPTSTFKAVDATTFTFTMPQAYIFTDPILTGIAALPMHIFEQIPADQWASSFLSTLQNTPTKVTWNVNKYGGNGSYAWVYGPIGDGPYMYRGYDKVARVGTLVRFDNYWNASGLQALGQFNVKTIHVLTIVDKDAALAEFRLGRVNFLDPNYQFTTADISTVTSYGGVTITSSDPSAGWQELGLNLNHPVYGTGLGTPLGKSDPSKAHFAALMVRKALSYLIPRDYIIKQLLQGRGLPGTTQFGLYPAYQPPGLTPDPYDPTAARRFLAQAGYPTGVSPGSSGGSITFPPVQPVKVGNVSVSVPDFLLGNTLTLSGSFTVDPVLAFNSGGFAVILQQSTDEGKTWTPVTFVITTPGTGRYTISYSPTVTGSVWYRVLFTGIPGNYVYATSLSNASLIQAQLLPDFGGGTRVRPANVTQPAYGPVTKLRVGTLADLVNALVQAQTAQLQSVANQLTGSISSLSTNTQNAINQLSSTAATKTDLSSLGNQLTSQVNSLSSQVSTLTNVAYAALAVALVLGLIAIGLSRRKPKG